MSFSRLPPTFLVRFLKPRKKHQDLHRRDILHHHGYSLLWRYPPFPPLRHHRPLPSGGTHCGSSDHGKAPLLSTMLVAVLTGIQRCHNLRLCVPSVQRCGQSQWQDRFCCLDRSVQDNLFGDQGYLGTEYCAVVSLTNSVFFFSIEKNKKRDRPVVQSCIMILTFWIPVSFSSSLFSAMYVSGAKIKPTLTPRNECQGRVLVDGDFG